MPKKWKGTLGTNFCTSDMVVTTYKGLLHFQHHPATKMVCIENTHNITGGKAVSGEWVVQVGHICQARKIPLHCDGARIFNAAVALRDALQRDSLYSLDFHVIIMDHRQQTLPSKKIYSIKETLRSYRRIYN